MNFILKLILCTAGGLLYSMGFPHVFHTIGPLGPFLGLGLLFICTHQVIFHQNAKTSKYKDWLIPLLVFLLSINLFGYYWIPYTISEFGEIHAPWNYLISSFFSLIILPQLFVFYFLIHFIGKRSHIFSAPLLIAILLTTLEIIIPQQFPTHLGHSWLSLAPYLFFAPLLGVPFYSFILYWPLFSAIKCLSEKKLVPQLLISFSILLLSLVISFLFPLHFSPEQTMQVRLVQANIGNNLKIESEKFSGTAATSVQELYTQLSLTPQATPIDLIIWPETAYPRIMQSADMQTLPYTIPLAINQTIGQSQAALLTGGYDLATKNENKYYFESQYNAAFFFEPHTPDFAKLSAVYHKRQLIPFGETLPFGPLNQRIGDLIPNISFFAKGERLPLFQLKDKTFITSICYEVLFPSLIRDYLNHHQRVDFLVNISNDSWYGKTIEPKQHLFLTHWRAVEFNLPIIRMTNTGHSSILYPDGSESHRSDLMKRQVLDLPLLLNERETTLYQRLGNWGMVILWSTLIAIGLIARRKSFF